MFALPTYVYGISQYELSVGVCDYLVCYLLTAVAAIGLSIQKHMLFNVRSVEDGFAAKIFGPSSPKSVGRKVVL